MSATTLLRRRVDAPWGLTLLRAVRAEASKARSASFSPAAVTITVAATVVVAASIGGIASHADSRGVPGEAVMQPQFALIGLLTVGVLALLTNAAWLVGGETLGRTAGVTAVVMPRRVTVLAAKAVVAAATTFVAAVILVPVAGVIAASFYRQRLAWPSEVLGDDTVRITVVLPLVFACLSVAVVGLSAAVGRIAVAAGIIVLWYTIAEDWIARIPVIGEAVAPFLPVSLSLSLAGIEGDAGRLPGGPAVGAVILIAVAVGLFALGAVRVMRRDIAT